MYTKSKEFVTILDKYPDLSGFMSCGVFKLQKLAECLRITIDEAKKLIVELIMIQAIKNGPHGYKLYGEALSYFNSIKRRNEIENNREMWRDVFERCMIHPRWTKEIQWMLDNYGLDFWVKLFLDYPTFKVRTLRSLLGKDVPLGIVNFHVLLPLQDLGILVQLTHPVAKANDGILKPSDEAEVLNFEFGINPDFYESE